MAIVLVLICLLIAGLISKYLKSIPYNVLAGALFLGVQNYIEVEGVQEIVSISLAFVFASAAFGNYKAKGAISQKFLLYSILQYSLQWSLGLGVFIFILGPWLGVTDPVVGLSVPASLAGGYGSAAFLGEVYKLQERPEVFTLLMFAATLGVFVSLVGSIVFTKGKGISFESFSIDRYKSRPMAYFVLILICVLAMGLKLLIGEITALSIPLFAISFVLALGFKLSKVSIATGAVSNISSDILIVAGIGSIKLSIMKDLLAPTIFALGVAVIVAIFVFKLLGEKLFKDDSFEKSLFTWGWSMGGIAIAVGVIQSISSKKAQKVMGEFAPVYMIIAPFELMALASSPYLVSESLILPTFGIFGLISVALLIKLGRQVSENS